jgi:hypothetical protein
MKNAGRAGICRTDIGAAEYCWHPSSQGIARLSRRGT